ncbi:hypothetical protein M8C21_004492, partial [Ambrosia artemisiifolia]
KLQVNLHDEAQDVLRLCDVMETWDVELSSIRETLELKDAELLEHSENVAELEVTSHPPADERSRLHEQIVDLTEENSSLKDNHEWLLQCCITEVEHHVKRGSCTTEVIGELVLATKIV